MYRSMEYMCFYMTNIFNWSWLKQLRTEAKHSELHFTMHGMICHINWMKKRYYPLLRLSDAACRDLVLLTMKYLPEELLNHRKPLQTRWWPRLVLSERSIVNNASPLRNDISCIYSSKSQTQLEWTWAEWGCACSSSSG